MTVLKDIAYGRVFSVCELVGNNLPENDFANYAAEYVLLI